MTRKVVLIVINSLCLGLINEIAQQRQAEKRKERINERKKERKRNETRVDILKTQHRSSVDAKNKTLVFPSGKTTKFALCTFSLILSLSSKQNKTHPFPTLVRSGGKQFIRRELKVFGQYVAMLEECVVTTFSSILTLSHSLPISITHTQTHTHANTHT